METPVTLLVLRNVLEICATDTQDYVTMVVKMASGGMSVNKHAVKVA